MNVGRGFERSAENCWASGPGSRLRPLFVETSTRTNYWMKRELSDVTQSLLSLEREQEDLLDLASTLK